MAAANRLKLSIQCVQEIARQVAEPPQRILSAKQCKDLSSKLLKVIGNIQELVSSCEASAVVAFEPALEEFQRIVEEARTLVQDCARADWLKASVFQIRNEEAFRELLLKLGLCYNVIYEQAKAMSLARGLKIKVEDLCSLPQSDPQSFTPALEEEVREDQQTLQERLEEVNKSPEISNHVILARYLLSRLAAPAMAKDWSLEVSSILYNASTLQVSDKQLKKTWGGRCKPFPNVSGAAGVFRTEWIEIKCAKKIFSHSGTELHRTFGKEAAILASIDHPNIVKFFCCGFSSKEKLCFIVMELMQRSLSDLIEEQRGQPFRMHVALDIILQIARGMLYMHEYGIAHRDLKPQNVGVSKAPNGTFCVKLLDFGLSKIKVQVSEAQDPTFQNTGTTKYRAPEACKDANAENGKQKVKWFRADVYSFAVTCYQILTLQVPYPSIGNTALYQRLKDDTRLTLPADCPRPLSVLIEECWAWDFNARPNFGSICERLEKFKHDLLLQGLRGENVVASSSSYKHIETMLKRRSERRTPAKHLAESVQNEGEGYIDDGAIGEPGVDEMEYASPLVKGGMQPSKNDLSNVLGDADQSKKDKKKVKEAREQPLGIGSSSPRREVDQRCQGEEDSKCDEVVDQVKANREKRSYEALSKRERIAGKLGGALEKGRMVSNLACCLVRAAAGVTPMSQLHRVRVRGSYQEDEDEDGVWGRDK